MVSEKFTADTRAVGRHASTARQPASRRISKKKCKCNAGKYLEQIEIFGAVDAFSLLFASCAKRQVSLQDWSDRPVLIL